MTDLTHWAYGHVTESALLADADADITNWPAGDTSLLDDAAWPIDQDEWHPSMTPATSKEAIRTRGADGVLRGQGKRNGAFEMLALTADKMLYIRTERFPDGVNTAPATIRYRDFGIGGYRVLQCMVDLPRELDGATYGDGVYLERATFAIFNGQDAP